MDYNRLVSSLPDNVRNCHLLLVDYQKNPDKHLPHIQKFYSDMISTQCSSSSSRDSPKNVTFSSHSTSHFDPFEASLGKWVSDSESESETENREVSS